MMVLRKTMNTSCFVCRRVKTCCAKSLDITTDRDERKQTPITEMSSINFPDRTKELAYGWGWVMAVANEQANMCPMPEE